MKIRSPYPENEQELEEEGTEGSTDESNDSEFEPMQHLADGGFAGDFDVDGGDSDTIKGLPVNPAALPQPMPPLAQAPMAAPAPKPVMPPPAAAAPARPMPGMPPGVTPDMLQQYLGKQRAAIGKYSPDRQFAQEQAMLKAQGGLGGALAHSGATLADGIMQGVAGAGNPGFAKQMDERNLSLAGQAAGSIERGRKGTMEQVEAGQKIDAQDPGSPLSQAYQKAFGSIFAKMGYDPGSVAKMPASQINTVADLGVRYADAQTQLELKKAMLQVQTLTAMANMSNQQQERAAKEKEIKKGAAEEVAKHYVSHPINAYKANQTLADIAQGKNPEGTTPPTGPYGAVTTKNGKTYEWSPSTGKYHLKTKHE